MKSMNKKALEDTLFTWIAAVLIFLFFAFFFYFLPGFMMFGEKKLSWENENIFYETKSKTIVVENFIGFLNKEIEFNNKKMKVKDLVVSEIEENSGKSEKFKELGNEFLNKENLWSEIKKAWIKTYIINETTKEFINYDNGKFDVYITKTSYYAGLGYFDSEVSYCNPEKDILYFILIKNKKIELCLE